MRSRLRGSRVFLRYCLSYALVLLLVFGLLTVYLYDQTSRQVRRQISDSQTNRLTRIADAHESLVLSMLNTAEELGLSPYIEPFDFTREPWKAYDLQKHLIPYTAASSFCDQVYVHFRDDRYMYSSASSMTVDMFCSMVSYEKLTPDMLMSRIMDTQRMDVLPWQWVESGLTEGGRAEMVTFLMPLGANPRTSKGTILFQLRGNVYEQMFADAIAPVMNTYILLNGQVLAQSESLDVTSADLLEQMHDGTGPKDFRLNGKNYVMFSLDGRNWGMQYVTVMRSQDVVSSVRANLLRAFSMLGILAGLGMIVALVLARRHARPIESLNHLLNAETTDVRGDELHNITTGIEKLRGQNKELTMRLESALPMRRRELVLRILKGRFETREELTEAARAVGVDTEFPYYAIVLSGSGDGTERPEDLMGEPFQHWEKFAGVGVELVALKAHLYLCFSGTEEQLRKAADAIRNQSLENGGTGVTAMSTVQTDIMRAPAAYLEAAAAYDNRFVMGSRQVLRYEDISSSMTSILPAARTLTQNISQALTLRDREVLDRRIRDLMDFLRNTDMSPFAFRMIYNDVIDVLTRDHAEEVTQARSAWEIYDIFTLSSCQSLDDLDEMLRQLCTHMLDADIPVQAEHGDEADPMKQVVEYIQAHYQDPEISMTAIAESFDLSTARLSGNFRERMGMPPLEYLTLLRCEHAKALLEQGNETIRDVGLQCGYYDSGTFIRRFKQQTGMTPLQYRRSHRSDQEGKDEHCETE